MSTDERSPLAVSVGLTRKVNLGNYESAEASVYISGVMPDTSAEEIEAALSTGKLAWGILSAKLNEQVAGIRESRRASITNGGQTTAANA